jgi:hypothetical protein
MKVQSRRLRGHRVIGKYIAVTALMASGLTVGLAGVAAADNVPTTSTVGALHWSFLPTACDDLDDHRHVGYQRWCDRHGLLGGRECELLQVINGGAAGAAATASGVRRVATFTVTDAVGQAVTYQATDVTDAGEVVIQTATVTFKGRSRFRHLAGSYNTSAFAAYTAPTAGTHP